MRVGVVGAGISGLVCAKRLLELVPQRLEVTTLEWGRGPGGRTARRRVAIAVADGDAHSAQTQQPTFEKMASFDHAAPFFSARTKTFRDGVLKDWEASGLAAEWKNATITQRTLIEQEQQEREETFNDQEREPVWVGLPSNNAIAKGIVRNIEASRGGSCLFGQYVQMAEFDDTNKVWKVRVSDRNAEDAVTSHIFDALVLSDKLLVLPNTYAVLDPVEWRGLAIPSDLGSTGAVVLLVAFHEAPNTATSDVWHMARHPLLQTIIHDSAKPGRDQHEGLLDLWVVHSTPEYATSHLVGEQLDDEKAVRQELLDAFLQTLAGEAEELSSRLAHVSVMAWDHAQPLNSKRLETSHFLDAPRRAGVCGDFFLGSAAPLEPRGVEAAALSGLALAEALAPLLA